MTKPPKTSLTLDADADAVSDGAAVGATDLNSKAAGSPPNPFDPAALRLDQSFASPSVKTLLTTVPVRKPLREHFVRVHPSKDYQGIFGMIEFKEDREYYLLMPGVASELPGEFQTFTLFTAITRQGKVFLWPVKTQDPNGRSNEWHRSAGEAALRAQKQWVRVRADMALGANEISVAEATLSEPNWPNYSFGDLLSIAFRDRLVNTTDHPVVKKLRGLI